MKIYILLAAVCHFLYAQWEADRRLTFNAFPAFPENNARCIVSNSSYVHIAWSDNRTGNWEIFYKQSSNNGTDWSPDIQLTNNASSSLTPSLAAINNNVYIVWADNRVTPQNIFFKISNNYGATWSSDTQISHCASSCNGPCLAADDSFLHLVYTNLNGLYYNRSSNQGTTWIPDTCLVNRSGLGLSSISTVGQKIHTIFLQYTCDSIFYLHSLDGGDVWGPIIGLDGYNSFGFGYDAVYEPSLTAADSVVLSVWATYTYVSSGPQHEYWGLGGKRSTDNGTVWSSRFGIPQVSNNRFRKYTPAPASFNFNFHVVHSSSDYDGTQHHIAYGNSSDYGANWGPGLYLSPDFVSSKIRPFIAQSGPYTHVIWLDDRNGSYDIYYKRNYPGACNEHKNSEPFYGSEWRGLRNPFTSYARIEGSPTSIIVVYNITGKIAGRYRSDRIGEDLQPGVYFLSPGTNKDVLIKIVKVK